MRLNYFSTTMTDISVSELMQQYDVKATPNRIIVLKQLLKTSLPKSLIELESEIGSLERSSILRVLTLFNSVGMLHIMEDGRGVTKYEICHSHGHCSIDDMHAHFYCERCHRTICFEEASIPVISLPDGFTSRSVNFMIKGICAECNSDV